MSCVRRLNNLHIAHIQELVSEALKTDSISRICLHESDASDTQFMIISIPSNSQYPKHYHPSKDEYYYLISGELHIETYGDDGVLNGSTMLEEGGIISARIKKNIIHSVSTKEKLAVFIEISSGPFLKSSTIKFKD